MRESHENLLKSLKVLHKSLKVLHKSPKGLSKSLDFLDFNKTSYSNTIKNASLGVSLNLDALLV